MNNTNIRTNIKTSIKANVKNDIKSFKEKNEVRSKENRENVQGRSNLAAALEARQEFMPGSTQEGSRTASEPEIPANPLTRILDLNRENIVRGIILAEVLGRPRCKRKGRW